MPHHPHHHGTIDLGSADTSYELRGNHVTVIGTGNDTITGHHTNHDTIDLGDGNDSVTITGNHDTIILGNGVDSVTITGNHDTVIVENANGNADKIKISGNHDSVTVGTGTTGAGDTVLLGSHSVHDHVSVVGTGGTNTITTVAGDNHNSFDLGASDSSLTLFGNHNFVFVNGGTDTITDSPSGKDFLKLDVGSSGALIDIFNFSAAHGVVGLDPALGFASGGDAAAALGPDAGGTGTKLPLPFPTGGLIDFHGLPPGTLDADNFFII